jgi:NitT/TauT family transport system substrate-binding protein
LIRNRLLIVLLMAALAAGCTRAPADGRAAPQDGGKIDKVTLLLNWYPEAEHGGYYAALVRGYYREAGLDVTILAGVPNTPVIQEVATAQVTFGVDNADKLLLARAQKAPVTAVMAPLQTSPRCLIVHKKAGIKDFEDLHDMTIAVTTGAAFADYLRVRMPLKNVKFVPYTNLEAFLSDDNYAQQGYVFSEPYVARQKGGDPQILMLADLGFNPYTSLLLANEAEIRRRPDLVRRMVAASVRGWQDYLDNPQPTNEYIHEKNPAMDMGTLAYGAKTIAPLVLTDESRSGGLGTMTLARWQTLTEQLVEAKQLSPGKVDPKNVFTDEFLPQPSAE